MLISQLIAILEDKKAKYGDREVAATWESRIFSIDPEDVYLGKVTDDPDYPGKLKGQLLIDVDGCFYRDVLEDKSKIKEPKVCADCQRLLSEIIDHPNPEGLHEWVAAGKHICKAGE